MTTFFKDIYRSCRSHDLMNLSANISFFAILSLLPLLMIFVSVLGYVMGAGDIVTELTNRFTEFIPGAQDIFASNLMSVIKGKSSLGFWGVGFLLVISTVLFGSLERAFDLIFGSEKKRHFIYSQLLAILVIFIILIFLSLPSAVKVLEAALSKHGFYVPLAGLVSGKAFFIGFMLVAYNATVIIVTNHRVYFRNAFLGSLIFAVGTTVAKYLFQWYLLMALNRYNLIYGSLTAMILTVIWIYYVVMILLLSAEVVAYLQKRCVK